MNKSTTNGPVAAEGARLRQEVLALRSKLTNLTDAHVALLRQHRALRAAVHKQVDQPCYVLDAGLNAVALSVVMGTSF